LVVEPDENFVHLLQLAIRALGLDNPIHVVSDGLSALDYLCARGQFADRSRYPFPSIIFSEIRLPLLSGLEVLTWLRDHPECSVIPMIILSASDQDSDIREAYHLGANSYIIKPATLPELEKALRNLYGYWEICAKPQVGEKC
jgi:CheY-like chemotaxis protein